MKYIFTFFIIISFVSCVKKENTYLFDDEVKITLREIGDKLLLANLDSISVVKPIEKIEKLKYQLSFENELSIQPDSLVNYIKQSIKKSTLSNTYLVEVIQCDTKLVAYSYKMSKNFEKGVIPCSGRELRKRCYEITIHFKNISATKKNDKLYFVIIVLLGLTIGFFIFNKNKPKKNINVKEVDYINIGIFTFYSEQNILTNGNKEINLSKKESEILQLLLQQPNQVIKRDYLSKKVWEDNGVIVGRSLDTYISKLRKKLQEDDSIRITNIHGIGYKLEM